jgi:hypothetical protein
VDVSNETIEKISPLLLGERGVEYEQKKFMRKLDDKVRTVSHYQLLLIVESLKQVDPNP